MILLLGQVKSNTSFGTSYWLANIHVLHITLWWTLLKISTCMCMQTGRYPGASYHTWELTVIHRTTETYTHTIHFICFALLCVNSRHCCVCENIRRSSVSEKLAMPQVTEVTHFYHSDVDWSSWPVSAWFYALCCCYIIAWLDICMNVQVYRYIVLVYSEWIFS